MKKNILYILFIMLIFPPSAIGHFSYSYEPILRSEQIAIQYWNSPFHCSIPFPIRYVEPISANLIDAGPEQTALEHNEVELIAWDNPNDPNCIIYINRNIWNSGIKEFIEFHYLCDIITHEIGHFLGYTDTNQNPNSIKYPIITFHNYNSVSGCIKHSFNKRIIKELEKETLQNQKIYNKSST